MTNWKDIIPSIPLARGVPVIAWDHYPDEPIAFDEPPAMRGVISSSTPAPRWAGDSRPPSWVVADDRNTRWLISEQIRVDLSDGLGFAYALRYYDRRRPHSTATHRRDEESLQLAKWLISDMSGITTDADRLALAKALVEVTA